MIVNKIVTISKDQQVHSFAAELSDSVFAADDVKEALTLIGSIQPDLVLCDCCHNPQLFSDLTKTSDNIIKKTPVVIYAEDNKCHPEIDYQKYHHLFIDNINDAKSIASKISKMMSLSKITDSQNENFFVDELAQKAGIAGQSSSIVNMLKMIKLVANSNCNPVLIVGETGTGKEVVAKAVHEIKAPEKPFVAMNCAALTASLLESELFGHVKGAFTGAEKEKTGLLEAAGDGTVFLDEISEMPLELQAKLLRLLQEKEFRKVGGTKVIQCKATIIASSNRDLKTEVQNKNFRSDLFYRLNVCPIKIDPLRSENRKEDIAVLAKYFLQTSDFCPDKIGKINSITTLAVDALLAHDWAGNVRELKNVVDRAILFESSDKVGLSSIILEPTDLSSNVQEDACQVKVSNFSLAKAEQELISSALKQTGWQKTQAASLLGISRATLYAKLEQYKIQKQTERQKTKTADNELLEVS